MNTKFTAAAQAIAEHFKQAEAQRGEPFRDTFINPMCNDAVTPNFVGIPIQLLRQLIACQVPEMFLADGVTSNPEWIAFKHSLPRPEASTEPLGPLVGCGDGNTRLAPDRPYSKPPAVIGYQQWDHELERWDRSIADRNVHARQRALHAGEVFPSSHDLKKVGNPDAGAVLQPAQKFDPYSGRN